MLSETLALVIQLPPLAFGPARPPEAFAMPRALRCEVRELGQVRVPAQILHLSNKSIDLNILKPAAEPFIVNRPVDLLMFLAAAYGGRATWDDRPWAVRTWQATGAAAPLLIPPQPPPFQSTAPR